MGNSFGCFWREHFKRIRKRVAKGDEHSNPNLRLERAEDGTVPGGSMHNVKEVDKNDIVDMEDENCAL